MDISNLRIETQRLIIRPYRVEDYHNWYTQFDNRLPSQYKYDDGRTLKMTSFTQEWFTNWISGFEKSAKNDEMYNLGVFRKRRSHNLQSQLRRQKRSFSVILRRIVVKKH